MVVGDRPLNACHDRGRVAGTRTGENADRDDGRVLRHTVRSTSHGAGNVGPVAVAVAVASARVTRSVPPRRDASTEVLVGAARPGVDHIRRHSGPVRVVGERAVQGQGLLIDAVQPPWRARLARIEGDDGVLPHAPDGRVALDLVEFAVRHLDHQGVKGILREHVGVDAVGAHVRGDVISSVTASEPDDVATCRHGAVARVGGVRADGTVAIDVAPPDDRSAVQGGVLPGGVDAQAGPSSISRNDPARLVAGRSTRSHFDRARSVCTRQRDGRQ